MAEKNRKDLTKEQFEDLKKLCSIFCTREEAAAFFNIDAETLSRNIKDEFGVGWIEFFSHFSGKGKMSLRKKQYEIANSGNVTMLIWLGKQYLGQSDKIENQINEIKQSVINVKSSRDKPDGTAV